MLVCRDAVDVAKRTATVALLRQIQMLQRL